MQFTYDTSGFPIPFTGQQPDIAVSALFSLDSSEYDGILETGYGHEQISEIPLLPVCNLTDQQKERIASSRAAAVARKATKAKERALAMIQQCAVRHIPADTQDHEPPLGNTVPFVSFVLFPIGRGATIHNKFKIPKRI